MKKGEDYSAMYKIANYYYMDNLSQQEIANKLGVSRSQVSRLLILARERGIVEIKINMPDSGSIEEKRKQLCELLGLKKVYICETSLPDNSKANSDQLNLELGAFAASIMPELIEESKIIGIGRGTTIYNTAKALSNTDSPSGKMIVPMAGNAGSHNRQQQTSAIVSIFADSINADAFFVNSPICRKDYGDVIGSGWYMELCGYWDKLDTAIFGIGGFSDSFIKYIDDLPKDLYEFCFSQKGEGEITGQPFSKSSHKNGYGSIINGYVYIGLPIDRLKKIDNTICIAGGSNKVDAIKSAASLGYIKTLVTDSLTAGELVASFE